jgi:hypothetical protein
MPETEIVFEPVTGEAVEPKTAFALSVMASVPTPLLVERFTVTEVMVSVPALVVITNSSTSVAAASGAMVFTAGSEPVERVDVAGCGFSAKDSAPL